MDLLVNWSDEFLWGIMIILQAAGGGLLLGMVWAVLAATALLSNNRFAKIAGDAFSTAIRGIPELIVILIVYFGSTVLLTKLVQLWDPETTYVEVGPMSAGIFALSLVFGAYGCQVIKGAILAIPVGQMEAARAVGMSNFQVFRRITLPQMWRFALPGLGNHWISLIKDTSLVSVVGLEDIMRVSDMAIAVDHNPFVFYLTAAAIYMGLNFVNTDILARLEFWANRGMRRT